MNESAIELLTAPIRARMTALEAQDEADGVNGTPQSQRLRAVPPEVGRLLMTLALAIRATTIVEVGTSGGYSTLWLAAAARRNGGRITTFEVDSAKVELARRTFEAADVEPLVDLRHGDGGAGLAEFAGRADLVFIDSEKDDYVRLLGLAIRALRTGGLLIADNLMSHASWLVEFRERALSDPRLSGLVVPVGGGELLAVRV